MSLQGGCFPAGEAGSLVEELSHSRMEPRTRWRLPLCN